MEENKNDVEVKMDNGEQVAPAAPVAPEEAPKQEKKRPPTIEEVELADHRKSAAFKEDDEHKVKDSGAAHSSGPGTPVDSL